MFKPSTDDVRIAELRPLIAPAVLMEEIKVSDAAIANIVRYRQEISDVLQGKDQRLVIVVGPCSVHDPKAALDYAQRLLPLIARYKDDLMIVMRTYFEKPRTTIGWKGLINDPNLDGSFDINRGLHVARTLLRDVAEMAIPTGTEFLDPISPQFMADLVSWGAIGARTTESQVHRELASGLSMPVGFKNGTRGTIKIAVEAVQSAQHPHHFLSVTKEGTTAIVSTKGNKDCHVILRGGEGKPNYDAESVSSAVELLKQSKLEPRVMIDCSHANSSKDYKKQSVAADDICKQVSSGSKSIFGVMVESFLIEGRQDFKAGKEPTYGQSITDACIGWDETEKVLESFAKASRARRKS